MAADWINLAVSSALVVLTAVLALYTRILSIEAKKSRRVQTDPNVIITAVHDDDRPTILMLVVKNIGNGLATDIKFTPSEPLLQAFGLDERTKNDPTPFERGPFVTGVPTLGPGDQRKVDWGQPGGLSKLLAKESIIIECEFKSQDGRSHVNECMVDVESFMGTNASRSMLLRTVRALEIVADNTKKALDKL